MTTKTDPTEHTLQLLKTTNNKKTLKISTEKRHIIYIGVKGRIIADFFQKIFKSVCNRVTSLVKKKIR